MLIHTKYLLSHLYETIELDELIKVLMKVMPSDGMKIVNFMKEFKGHLTRHDKENLMKPFMSAIVELCQNLLNDDGKP